MDERRARLGRHWLPIILTDDWYNVPPGRDVPIIYEDDGEPRFEGFRWGLVPFWADDPKIAYRMINARSETVTRKPAFRAAWKHRRRCVILAHGFYEWQRPNGGRGPKQPYYIGMADERLFGVAGLWESWTGEGEELRSCTILTTSPNALLEPIHNRMPVILGDENEWDRWIDADIPPEGVAELLRPYAAVEMHAYPVSTFVNKPGNDGPECIEPVQLEPEQGSVFE